MKKLLSIFLLFSSIFCEAKQDLFTCLTYDSNIEPLSGGYTNATYRVDKGSDAFVIRVGREAPEELGIDREMELFCHKSAAMLGVSPPIILSDLESRILVTPYIQGKTLKKEDLHEKNLLRRAVETIRSYHSTTTSEGTCCVYSILQIYLSQIEKRAIELPASIAFVKEQIEKIKESLPKLKKLVLCHNDLTHANFIQEEERLWIIDWEYAGFGDPYFDLASLCIEQQLPIDLKQFVLECYEGTVSAEDKHHFEAMCRLYSLRDALWYYLQIERQKAHASEFARLAKEHFSAFISQAD